MQPKLNTVSAIAVAFGLLLSFPAKACSPADLTPQQIIEYADEIIVAQAVSSDWSSGQKTNIFDAIARSISQILPQRYEYWQGKTVFKIHRVIKGKAAGFITIRHDVNSAACGITFNAHDNYLIFVQENKKKYFTSVFGVRPFLTSDGYKELAKLVGVTKDDYLDQYQDYLPAEEGGQIAVQDKD